MENHGTSSSTLLIFPPVWTPVTPYLALPLLTAYLKTQGLSVTQYDASQDFFTKHLLHRKTLSRLLNVILDRDRHGEYTHISDKREDLLKDLKRNPELWKEKILRVEETLGILKDQDKFYEPSDCIRAQDNLYKLLRMASLAFYPSEFTFNTFTNPEISDFPGLIKFCDDHTANPFLGFYGTLLPKLLEQAQNSLVGVSISTSHQMAGGLSMARFIKKISPDAHIVLGGRHVVRLQEAFARAPEILPKFCDSLIPDNGERPLMRLIHALQNGDDLTGIPGLIYFDRGDLVFNERGPHEPISNLPTPDFSDLPLGEYLSPTPIIPVRLSEGCYWGKCTFCSRYDTRAFQTIPPESAVSQMEELHRLYGVHCFTVNDDCLTPVYLEKVSKIIIEKGLKLQISLWCKPLGSFTKERVDLLAKAGVRLVRWGLETGHPRILRLMNKGTNLSDTRRVLRNTSKAGIWNHATMILGFPSETEEEAEATLQFLKDNRDIIHSSILFRFILLNHSYIIHHPEEFGIKAVLEKSNPLTYEHEFIPSEGMDGDTLASFMDRAQKYRLEEIYSNPFWFYLRIREYLLLYCSRHGLDRVRSWKVNPENLTLHTPAEEIRFLFQRPSEIPAEVIEKIRRLIVSGGEVGPSWIEENLKEAFLVGYAMAGDNVAGTMTHKRPKKIYVKAIEEKTGLNLEGYLERGYTFVAPEYRGLGVGDRLLKGLVERSRGKKIYVTINDKNREAIKLTLRNRMKLAARFSSETTGNSIHVYITPQDHENGAL